MTGSRTATGPRIRTGRRLVTGGLILVLLLAAGPALATPLNHHLLLLAQRDQSHNNGISPDEAVRLARRYQKGKVLSVETIRINGRKVYRIKILTKKGRVKRIKIDARTGKRISRKR